MRQERASLRVFVSEPFSWTTRVAVYTFWFLTIVRKVRNVTYCRNGNEALTESSVDFSSASNSSPNQLADVSRKAEYWKWRQCDAERGTEAEQSGWLSDYPVLRNICNLRLRVPPFPRGRLPLLLPSLSSVHPSSPYRRAVEIFHFHFAEVVRSCEPSCRALFSIEGPRGSRWLP